MKKFSHKSKLYHLEGSMFNHTLLALANAKKKDLDLLYALLFHDSGKPQVGKKVLKAEGWVISTSGHADASADIFLKFAKKLKFPRKNQDTVEWLIRKHMLQVNFCEMRPAKQVELASHPAFELLLEHWSCDHNGSQRASGFSEHTAKYEKSQEAGRQLLQRLKVSGPLVKKLARGELVMQYSELKPGVALGQKIREVKFEIILGNIKNENDLKGYLAKRRAIG